MRITEKDCVPKILIHLITYHLIKLRKLRVLVLDGRARAFVQRHLYERGWYVVLQQLSLLGYSKRGVHDEHGEELGQVAPVLGRLSEKQR